MYIITELGPWQPGKNRYVAQAKKNLFIIIIIIIINIIHSGLAAF